MVTKVVESTHPGECIVYEASEEFRKAIVITTGQNLNAGTVLGQILKAGAAAVADGANTGDGVMGAITVSAGALAGDYTLTIIEGVTNAGAFIVEDPNGLQIGSGDVAGAFSDGGLAFTLADGATDFAAGDVFIITVADGNLEYTQLDLAGIDGSEIANCILFDAVEALTADGNGVGLVRDVVVNSADLIWPTGITVDQKAAAVVQLASAGVTAKG